MTPDDRVRRVVAAAHFTDQHLERAQRAAVAAIGGHAGSPSLWHRVESRMADLLASLFPHLLPGGGLAGLLGWALGVAIILGALWFGGVRLVTAAGSRRWRRAATDRPSGRSAAPVTYEDARAAALRLASTNPREALRQLYTATLAETARRRGWRPRPGQSNWWFVRRLGPSTPPGTALADCTRLFEQRVYGSAPTAEGDVHRADELSRVVLA